MELFRSIELEREKEFIRESKEEVEKPVKRTGVIKGNPVWKKILDKESVTIAIARDCNGKKVYSSKQTEDQSDADIKASVLGNLCKSFIKALTGNDDPKEFKIIGGDVQLLFSYEQNNMAFIRQFVPETSTNIIHSTVVKNTHQHGKVQGQAISQFLVQDYSNIIAE